MTGERDDRERDLARPIEADRLPERVRELAVDPHRETDQAAADPDPDISYRRDPGPLTPIPRRTLLVGAAAVGIMGLLGLRLVAGGRSKAGDSIERITDLAEVKAALGRLKLNPTQVKQFGAMADNGQLEMWRFWIGPGNEQTRFNVKTTLGVQTYSRQSDVFSFELPARRGEPAFEFNVLEALPGPTAQGTWRARKITPYDLPSGGKLQIEA